MAILNIIFDDFTRSNTSYGTVGNNWTDLSGNTWQISSNLLNGNNTNSADLQFCVRPSSEDVQDQSIKVNYQSVGGQGYALLRADRINHSGYLAFVNNSSQLVIAKITSSPKTITNLNAVSCGSNLNANGTSTIITFKATGTSPTTLVATVALAATPGTIIATNTITDSTAAMQITGGVGVTNGFGARFDNFYSYNENAPSATGYNFTGPSTGLSGSASSNFTVALSPSGSVPGTNPTTITPSDGGAGGTFTPTTVTLADTTQQANFTYTAASTGIKTISVANNGGFTNPASITYTAQTAYLVAGTTSATAASTGSLTLASTTPAGGTGTKTYQWYQSATAGFTPGAGNILSGKTTLTPTITGSSVNTLEFYKLVTTDSLAFTVTNAQFPYSCGAMPLSGSRPAFGTLYSTAVLGFIGDSTYAYKPTGAAADGGTVSVPIKLGQLFTAAGMTATIVNPSVAGTTTDYWKVGSTPFTSAKSSFASAGVTHVFIRLGANDSRNMTAPSGNVSAATYGSTIAGMVSDLVSSGYKVILSYPLYTVPGSYSNQFNENSTNLQQQYQAQLDALIDNVNVLAGDKLGYEYFARNPGQQVDGVHANTTGRDNDAELLFRATVLNFQMPVALPVLAPTIAIGPQVAGVHVTFSTAEAGVTGLDIDYNNTFTHQCHFAARLHDRRFGHCAKMACAGDQ